MSDKKREIEKLRERLEKKLSQLEQLSEHIQALFPKKIDARSAFVFTERLKAAAELYRLQLAYMQEIARLVEKLHSIDTEGINEELLTIVRQELKKLTKPV